MAEPPVTVVAYHKSAGTNLPVKRIVVHATSPSSVPFPTASRKRMALSTAWYFAEARSGGSAHYIMDVADEVHCLPDRVVAHHAPPNRHSIGIEICGLAKYTRGQWLSPQVWPAVQRAITRTRELCDRHGVPFRRIGVDELRADRRGVCGHVDVARAWNQSDHWDPGPGFPWDEFMGVGTKQEQITPGEAMARFPNAVDACWAPNGGVWVLGADGGVGAYGNAPLPASGPVSYPGLPAGQRQGDRRFLRIVPSIKPGKLYDLLADDGSAYSF